MVRSTALKNLLLLMFFTLLTILSLWDGAGGDYLRYVEIYDSILIESNRNFEFIVDLILKIFKKFDLDFVFVQSFLIIVPSMFYLYLFRNKYGFTLVAPFLYFFVVFGVGSPRQFIASVVIAFYLECYNRLSKNKFLILSFITLLLIYFVQKPAAVVFVFILLFLMISLGYYILVLFSVFLFVLFLFFEYDFVLYVFNVYINSGLYSDGYFYRITPFWLISYLMLDKKIIGLKFFLVFSAMFSVSVFTSFLGVNTLFDRVFILLVPFLMLKFEELKFFYHQTVSLILSSIYIIYWLSLLFGWYYFSESAYNWRMGSLVVWS